ncbi:MAG: bifunctional oligoribonuclease/PAP phosphatase NrnA [Anaerolineales bacterium]
MKDDLRQGREILDSGRQVVVLSHEHPDGDAIGSMLGLTLGLQAAGLTAVPVLAEGMPGRFRFLPGADQVKKTLPQVPSVLVAVDCADVRRVTSAHAGAPLPRIDLNIDHHPTNTLFGRWNWVDEKAAATSQILAELLPAWGLTIDRDVATNLMAGIVTDTLGFRTESVTPELLHTAARLIEFGVPLTDVYQRTLMGRSVEAVRYWGRALIRIQREGPLLWTALTAQDRRDSGYAGADDADLINLLTTIQDASLVILFVEHDPSRTKVSWRARPGLNVAELASSFGGGGHELASGATLDGGLEDVQLQVLASARRAIASIQGPK